VSTALAIFVKTPGTSPVKTRLAQTLGREQAERFHVLAAQAVAAVACTAGPDILPYWAVAESAALGHRLWTQFPAIWQGTGGLGERMDRVFSRLQRRHGKVLLLGADTPQIDTAILHAACRALEDPATPHVIGPASDGGFWLFGARCPVPSDIWHAPPYSSSQTARIFEDRLSTLGGIAHLSMKTDLDHAEDLPALVCELDALPAPLPAQQALRAWLEKWLGCSDSNETPRCTPPC